MSRPYRKILTRYARFRNPFARLFGYELTEPQVRLRPSSGDGFIFQSNGNPLYTAL